MENVCDIRSEIFLSRKAWVPTKRSVVKFKGIKPLHVKWSFNSKEEADGLIYLNLINLVKGYMQVPVVDFTDSFSPDVSDTQTSILIGLTLYYEDYGWIS